MRFAQVSAPVMAKGVEDTAFYRYQPLISLNEVGGDPGRFGGPVDDFHRAMAHAARRWPAGDAHPLDPRHQAQRRRAGPHQPAVRAARRRGNEPSPRWAQHNDRHKRDGWPDRNAEYLLYQTLVGAWPIERRPGRRPSWRRPPGRPRSTPPGPTPIAGYDDGAATPSSRASWPTEDFVADLEAFLAEHQLVERGRVNSLAQTALLLTCPGVPDLYQGTELWDLSLVDPDNRRPVDYEARRRGCSMPWPGRGPEAALARGDEGGPKLWLIHRLLRHRRQHPGGYGPDSGYEPLRATGARASARRGLHPRPAAWLSWCPGWSPASSPASADDWAGTTVTLPGGAWTDVLTGGTVRGGDASVADLWRRFPVAVLARQA